jgi:hypothetical protein
MHQERVWKKTKEVTNGWAANKEYDVNVDAINKKTSKEIKQELNNESVKQRNTETKERRKQNWMKKET